jgi:hypothetical protein
MTNSRDYAKVDSHPPLLEPDASRRAHGTSKPRSSLTRCTSVEKGACREASKKILDAVIERERVQHALTTECDTPSREPLAASAETPLSWACRRRESILSFAAGQRVSCSSDPAVDATSTVARFRSTSESEDEVALCRRETGKEARRVRVVREIAELTEESPLRLLPLPLPASVI